jgi:hypothetical protein
MCASFDVTYVTYIIKSPRNIKAKLRLPLQVLPPARALGRAPAAPRPPQVLHPFMFHQLMHVSLKKYTMYL